MSKVSFLRVLARLHPNVWEWIDPHLPIISVGRSFDRVELNPQPLPPLERLASRVQGATRAIADVVIGASYVGADVDGMLREIGDELCPRPPGPPIPWPRRWPTPWPPGEPYPIDLELITAAVQAEAAVVFGSYAADIEDEALSGAFAELADRLFDASVYDARQ
jgi:hypothetical protein